VLQPLLQEPGDRALGAPHGAVQEEHAPLGPVALRRALEDVDQAHQGLLEAEDGVLAIEGQVLEELEADVLLLVDDDLLGAVAEDHVVEALIGAPGDLGVTADDIEIFGEGAVPVLLLIVRQVLAAGDHRDQIRSGGHKRYPS